MAESSAAGATPPAKPVSFPIFAAVAIAITGRGVYEVIELVGRIFESAGAVFEGSPDAPGTLLALLPPSDGAAMQAVHLGLKAQTIAPSLRLGVDATEVHAKKEQDAKWQQVIDSALRLQKAARSGEAIAGDGIDTLTRGAAATEPLQVGEETYLLLTGVRDLAAVPAAEAPTVAPPAAEATAAVASTPSAGPVADAPTLEEEVSEETIEPTPPSDGWARPPEPAVEEAPLQEPESSAWAVPPEPEVVAEPEVLAEPRVIAEPEVVAQPPVFNEPVAAMSQPTARWGGTLIGRDAHLADLRARFDRVVAERAGACVLVTGEPGSGRTRLVQELAASLEGVRHLTVGCAPAEGGGARWPLAAIVEALAGLDPLASAEPTRARLAELFADAPDADRVVPHLAALLALGGEIEADRVRWALRRLIEVTVGVVPTLFQIDDIDRTGAGLIRLLADVATAAHQVPILFAITTTRETEGVPTVRLGPLADEEAAAMITDLLGSVEAGVDARIAARLNGTPMAVEQALALLIESGTLAPGQGRWTPLADLSRVPFPETTVGAIRQRLQALPPNELVVLGMAAVAGERFDVAPLVDVVPGDARAGVPASLEDLEARGFLIGGPDTYTFRHALLREATLPGVPDWARATTHEGLARDIERRAGDRVDRFAEQIGAHLAASAQLRPEAAANERSEALELVLRPAETAVDLGDLDGAARLEGLAATLVDDDAQRRAELRYLAAEHAVLADPDRSADRELEDAAFAASDADEDVDHRVKLLRARLRAMSAQDDALENARAAAEDAIAASPEGERSWALVSAWSLLGLVHAQRSQNGLVAEDLREAADNAAEVQLRREETAALRGAAAALLDGPVGVPDAEAQCVSFLERVHGPLAEHDLRGAIAVLRARRGAFDDARPQIAASIAALDELGAAEDLAVALHRAARIELLAGDATAAEPLMQRAMAAATHARDDALRAHLAASFAHMIVPEEDRLDEALALADVAEAQADDMRTQVGWRMARARVMVRRGRGAHAERIAREGLGIAEQTDSTDLRANALVWAADVRRHAGRPAEAEPFERRAHRLLERSGATAQAAALAAAITPTIGEQPRPRIQDSPRQVSAESAPSETAAAEPGPAEPAPPSTAPPPPEPAGATTLADEMMAMFSEPDQPATAEEPTADPAPIEPPSDALAPTQRPVDELAPTERPVAEIDATDELLDDPTRTAQEESHRRWFNR